MHQSEREKHEASEPHQDGAVLVKLFNWLLAELAKPWEPLVDLNEESDVQIHPNPARGTSVFRIRTRKQ